MLTFRVSLQKLKLKIIKITENNEAAEETNTQAIIEHSRHKNEYAKYTNIQSNCEYSLCDETMRQPDRRTRKKGLCRTLVLS